MLALPNTAVVICTMKQQNKRTEPATDSGHFRRLDPAIAPTIVQEENYQRIDSLPTPQPNGFRITIKKCQNREKHIRTTEDRTPMGPSLPTYNDTPEVNDGTGSVDTEVPTNQEKQATEVILNETATSAFTCDVCKQTFTTKRGLITHRSRHANEASATTASQIKSRLRKTSIPDPELLCCYSIYLSICSGFGVQYMAKYFWKMRKIWGLRRWSIWRRHVQIYEILV